MRYRLLSSVLIFFIIAVILGRASSDRTFHAVSHTHDDVGWLKTATQYYYGLNNTIQQASVKLIYDSVFLSLSRNASRKFVVVEIAFFSKWYDDQSSGTQEFVKELVRIGQIEFAGGGWCSHDEATTHYGDMLDQVSLGHQFIRKEFGESAIPQVHWQVDPFGHSAGQVILFSQSSAVASLFVSRIDYQDFLQRQQNQNREFLWAPSPSLGSGASVLGSMMLHSSYCPPIDFNFDILVNFQPVAKHCASSSFSTASCSDESFHTTQLWLKRLLALMTSDWAASRGDDVLLPLGCDFTYMQAETWFQSVEALRELVNGNRSGFDFDIVPSTPLQFTTARLRSNDSWTVKEDDFFPYSDGPHMFWTGFYTSRPTFKRFVRETSALLRAVRFFSATHGISSKQLNAQPLAEAVAQAQHHDALTGTAKQHVSFDYTKALSVATRTVERQISSIACEGIANCSFVFCLLRNESICSVTQESSAFQVTVWSSANSNNRSSFEIPILSRNVIVTCTSNCELIGTTVIPSSCLSSYQAAQRPVSCAPFHLIVDVVAPPATLFTVAVNGNILLEQGMRESDNGTLLKPSTQSVKSNLSASVETRSQKLSFDPSTGMLVSVQNKLLNLTCNMSMTVCLYKSSAGDSQSTQASGAYIFRPVGVDCTPVTKSVNSFTILSSGAGGSSQVVVEQRWTEWLSLRWFVPQDEAEFTVELLLTHLPLVDSTFGSELVVRFTSTIRNRDTFWSDSNGLELVKRVKNYRSSFRLRQTEQVAGNYFPVTAAGLIYDEDRQLTVLVDRPVGAASLQEGQLEFMVHRRLLHDDGRGVGEALNETEHVTDYENCDWKEVDCGTHFGSPLSLRTRLKVLLSGPNNNTWRSRSRWWMDNSALMLFSNLTGGTPKLQRKLNIDLRFLPPAVELLSLERLDSNRVHARFAHMHSCDSFIGCTNGAVIFSLNEIFPELRSAQRKTLTFGANWSNTALGELVDSRVLLKHSHLERPKASVVNNTRIQLFPMQLIAFEIQL